MSLITEVVLLAYPTSPIEIERIEAHNFEARVDHAHGQFLKRLDSDAAGGSKFASWDVFQAAFNYVSPHDVVTWFDELCELMPTVEFVLAIDSELEENTMMRTRLFD